MGNRDQGKDVENDEKYAVMRDGERSAYVYVSQGVALGGTLSPNLFKIYIYVCIYLYR